MKDPRLPVAVMDSGVGGLPYLVRSRELFPEERFVYLADRAGYPYGTKSREEIQAIVLDRVARLRRSHNPKALVIACNTASQAALAVVRAANPGFPIVGTVPAVKPAAERSASGTIGILATAAAVTDPYLDELVGHFAPGKTVVREGAQDLVAFVERDFLDAGEGERRAAVLGHVRRLVEAGSDEIVLACTHFLHVAEDIAEAAAEVAGELDARAGGGRHRPRIEVLDSRDGVSRRLGAVLEAQGIRAPSRGGGAADPDLLLLTGPEPFEEVYAGFARRFDLSGPRPLDEEGRAGPVR